MKFPCRLGLCQVNDPQKTSEAIDTANIIMVGEIVEVGPPPAFWSGLFAAYQDVRYKVIDVFKGTLPTKEVLVAHPVVHNSVTADKSHPGLSPALFSVGNRLIILLGERPIAYKTKEKAQNGKVFYKTGNENLDVLIASEENIALVRERTVNK